MSVGSRIAINYHFLYILNVCYPSFYTIIFVFFVLDTPIFSAFHNIVFSKSFVILVPHLVQFLFAFDKSWSLAPDIHFVLSFTDYNFLFQIRLYLTAVIYSSHRIGSEFITDWYLIWRKIIYFLSILYSCYPFTYRNTSSSIRIKAHCIEVKRSCILLLCIVLGSSNDLSFSQLTAHWLVLRQKRRELSLQPSLLCLSL